MVGEVFDEKGEISKKNASDFNKENINRGYSNSRIYLILFWVFIFVVGVFIFYSVLSAFFDNSDKDFNYYVDLAVNLKDPLVCNELETRKNDCYSFVAKRLLDSEICLLILNDNDLQGQCVLEVLGELEEINVEICDDINDFSKRGFCYRQVAILKNDSSVCEKIEDIVEKDLCLDDLEEILIGEKNDNYIFDCSILFSDCNPKWLFLHNDEYENSQAIISFCRDKCFNMSKSLSGFNVREGSTKILCDCV